MRYLQQLLPILIVCSLLMPALLLPGCSAGSRSANGASYATPSEASRNPLEAQRLTLEAADLIDTEPDRAEQLLREALTADLFHGPAHNNLGVLYLNQDQLYEAANEFEWARKLMPGHPDPRMNLALTLETAGRIDEALATYRSALEVYPGHIQTIQALTRLQLRTSQRDDDTCSRLAEIVLRGTTEQWREWAQSHVGGLGQ